MAHRCDVWWPAPCTLIFFSGCAHFLRLERLIWRVGDVRTSRNHCWLAHLQNWRFLAWKEPWRSSAFMETLKFFILDEVLEFATAIIPLFNPLPVWIINCGWQHLYLQGKDKQVVHWVHGHIAVVYTEQTSSCRECISLRCALETSFWPLVTLDQFS